MDFNWLILFQNKPMAHVFFNIKSLFGIEIRQLPISLMLLDIVFVGKEWSDSAQLQNAFPAVHHRQFILCHQILPCFLVVDPVAPVVSPCVGRVEQIDCLLSQHLAHLLQGACK